MGSKVNDVSLWYDRQLIAEANYVLAKQPLVNLLQLLAQLLSAGLLKRFIGKLLVRYLLFPLPVPKHPHLHIQLSCFA